MAKKNKQLASIHLNTRTWELIAVIGAVLLGLTVLLTIAFANSAANYGEATRMAAGYLGAADGEVSTDLMLQWVARFAAAQDQLFLKGAAIVLAFVTMVVGSLFVQRGLQAYFRTAIDRPSDRTPLQAAAPGLILFALGAVIVGIALVAPSRSSSEFPDEVPLRIEAGSSSPRRSI